MTKTRVLQFLALCVIALLTLAALEVAAQLAYRVHAHNWYSHDRKFTGVGMLEPHPYLGVCNVPNISRIVNGVRVTHNSFRLRGAEFARPKPPDVIRIVTLGGSTTYCVGVSDDQTWPYLLGKQFGKPYEPGTRSSRSPLPSTRR